MILEQLRLMDVGLWSVPPPFEFDDQVTPIAEAVCDHVPVRQEVAETFKFLEKRLTRKTPRNEQTTHKTPFDTHIPFQILLILVFF